MSSVTGLFPVFTSSPSQPPASGNASQEEPEEAASDQSTASVNEEPAAEPPAKENSAGAEAAAVRQEPAAQKEAAVRENETPLRPASASDRQSQEAQARSFAEGISAGASAFSTDGFSGTDGLRITDLIKPLSLAAADSDNSILSVVYGDRDTAETDSEVAVSRATDVALAGASVEDGQTRFPQQVDRRV